MTADIETSEQKYWSPLYSVDQRNSLHAINLNYLRIILRNIVYNTEYLSLSLTLSLSLRDCGVFFEDVPRIKRKEDNSTQNFHLENNLYGYCLLSELPFFD